MTRHIAPLAQRLSWSMPDLQTTGKRRTIPVPDAYQQKLVTPKTTRGVEAHWAFTACDTGQSVVLPDGRCDVILRDNIYRDDPPVVIVTGPATRPYRVQHAPGDRWRGLRFCPGNGVTLWKDAIATAADRVLRGPDALALIPMSALLTGQDMTLAQFAKRITSVPAPRQRIDHIIDALHVSGGRIRIGALARDAGYSSRHLARLFLARVGLSPKTYAQLVQFHRALRLIRTPGISLTAAALEAGYADHAHLARATQTYGGFSPAHIPADLSLPDLSIGECPISSRRAERDVVNTRS